MFKVFRKNLAILRLLEKYLNERSKKLEILECIPIPKEKNHENVKRFKVDNGRWWHQHLLSINLLLVGFNHFIKNQKSKLFKQH